MMTGFDAGARQALFDIVLYILLSGGPGVVCWMALRVSSHPGCPAVIKSWYVCVRYF